MLEEYEDQEILDELKKRIAFYKELGEITFYYSSVHDILAYLIEDNDHSGAALGDYWVLNGSYAIRATGNNSEHYVVDTNKVRYIIWEEILGKNVKYQLGNYYFELVSEGFLEALQPD